MAPPILELRGIAKRFGSVQALRGADFALRAGEIHALLGENGAGKSTLMHIAFGMVRPDTGEIRCDDIPVVMRSPRDARDRGIGMVHQHFTSVPALTVSENIALALGRRRWRGSRELSSRSQLLQRIKAGLPVDARVEALSVGQKQRLEIVKALAADARILLLDEPTSVLAPAEVEELLDGVRTFAQEGGAVVLITHKLAEVFGGVDRVTVLRQGRVTLSGPIERETRESLALGMIGEGGEGEEGAKGAKGEKGEKVVEAAGIVVPPIEGRGPGLREASFEVRAGEIVGIAAIEGNGQRELLLAVAGLLHPQGGRLSVLGQVALVPEDRTTEGLIPSLTITENVVLGFSSMAPWLRGPWLDWSSARRHTALLLPLYDVRAPGPDVAAATLSGGNQQKLILGRALAQRPALIVAENPSRGLDIRATVAVHSRLLDAARNGVAVLLYSSDLDEVLALANRVLVVAGGVVRAMPPASSRRAVGSAMLGLQSEPDAA